MHKKNSPSKLFHKGNYDVYHEHINELILTKNQQKIYNNIFIEKKHETLLHLWHNLQTYDISSLNHLI